jgi:hypothetical protein
MDTLQELGRPLSLMVPKLLHFCIVITVVTVFEICDPFMPALFLRSRQLRTYLLVSCSNLLSPSPSIGRYTAVGFHGTGHITYQQALAAVFLEGWFFLIIAASGFRTKIAKLIPAPVRISTAAGERAASVLDMLAIQTCVCVMLQGHGACALLIRLLQDWASSELDCLA